MDTFIEKIKKSRPYILLGILLGGIISLGAFSDSLDKIIFFYDKYFNSNSKIESPEKTSEIAHMFTGQISYLVLWRFSSNRDGKVTDRKFTPSIWIKNISNGHLTIEQIRIELNINGEKYYIYPESSIPLSAINAPCEFNEYGRLSTGAPFRGFDLSENQIWNSSYSFNIPTSKYGELKNIVEVIFEVKSQGGEWQVVTQDKFLFGSQPFHTQEMRGGSQAIFLYNREHKKGDTIYCIDNLGDIKIVLKR